MYIKDESKRLGQQAFKVFGGAYGMACWMSKNLGVELQSCGGIEGLRKTYLEKKGGVPTTFVTCTDGTMAARWLGQPSSWDRRLWCTCQKEVLRLEWIISLAMAPSAR